ncbi:MAG: 30S ribosomal protein S16, partial [candidate division Zixibacteria bacterium RBG_16_40_9]
GSNKRAFYRFAVTDSRMPRDGRFIEIIGHYHPIYQPARVELKEEKVFDWLKKGAQMSGTVESIFRNIGLLRKWEALKKGEDVSSLNIAKQLPERARKKKRKAKDKTVAEVKPETETKT